MLIFRRPADDGVPLPAAGDEFAFLAPNGPVMREPGSTAAQRTVAPRATVTIRGPCWGDPPTRSKKRTMSGGQEEDGVEKRRVDVVAP